VECPGDVFQVVARIRQGTHGGDVLRRSSQRQQAVVRADEYPPVAHSDRHGATAAADAGVDDRDVDPHRHVGNRACQHERALRDSLRRDAVRDVDDLDVFRDPFDHPAANAGEIVLETEVS
jgi:hypothetical protein